jgi:hypothetical protein
MSYEEIRIPEELDRAVQRAVGIIPRWHETLGEAVRDIATQRGVRRPENLISATPTRHEVKYNGETLYTYCFVDALMLPFVMQEGERLEVRSESPMGDGGEVRALVTRNSVEASPADAVVSFGAPEREMAQRRRRCALTSTPSPPEKSTFWSYVGVDVESTSPNSERPGRAHARAGCGGDLSYRMSGASYMSRRPGPMEGVYRGDSGPLGRGLCRIQDMNFWEFTFWALR